VQDGREREESEAEHLGKHITLKRRTGHSLDATGYRGPGEVPDNNFVVLSVGFSVSIHVAVLKVLLYVSVAPRESF
jgi:hypothetical protein